MKQSFKQFYLSEGRTPWNIFSVKRCNERWTFKNEDTGVLSYVKINPNREIESMKEFLESLGATSGEKPKTKGTIDYLKFASDIIGEKKSKIYIKSSLFEMIKKTWQLN